ncbi:MAG: class I SAM-dependent methyltransferase [Acidimicrobiales bacterium]
MPLRGEEYDARFARLAEQGQYLHGEADLVTHLVGDPPARILDAGCGTGRIAIELARRGYQVLGVDIEPAMLDVARAKAPELDWLRADLASLGDLGAEDRNDATFDVVLAAGNVMIFVQLGTEGAVVGAMASAVRPGGLVVAGFQVGRQLTVARYDELCAGAGLELVHRWATWERAPYSGGDYAVSVHRRSAP